MSTKIKYIGQNGYEELVETGLDECLLNEFQELLQKFSNTEGDCLEQSMVAAVTAIGQGISMYVAYKVSDLLVDKMIAKMGVAWTYINIGKLKNIINEKTKGKRLLGKAGGFLVKNFLMADSTANRIETMKLVNKEVERFDTHTFQQQNYMSQNLGNFEKKKDKLLKVRDSARGQNSELFRHKTLTSTWTNSSYDKKCYEAVTGQKATATGKGSWAKLYKHLNTLSPMAKDLEGNLISHAQLMLNNMNLSKINRMQ